MPRAHPSSPLVYTGKTQRTGKRGRPRKVYRDSNGKEYTYRPNRRWKPKFSRAAGPSTSWPTSSYTFRGDFASRLVLRWVTRRCDRCGEPRWASEQFRTEATWPNGDGTWTTRSTPIKMGDVMFPRAAYRYEKPDLTCTCPARNGQPTRKQVADTLYKLQVSRSKGRYGLPPVRDPV